MSASATKYPDLSRTDAGRWSRLMVDLTDAGFPAAVDERRHQTGVSRSITLKMPGHLIEVRDTWWPKNDSVWTGWQVWLEDLDTALTKSQRARLKKRSDVVAAVCALAESVAS